MCLVRYYSNKQYSFDTIMNQEVYFSSVSSFNDPMDSQFIILTAGEAELSKKSDMETILSFIGLHPNIKFYEPKNNKISELSRALESILKECIGVACFNRVDLNFEECRFKISPAMLSHYGSGQNGFCCSFKYNESFNNFKKVCYYKEFKHFSIRETIDVLNLKDGTINLNKLQSNPFTFKNIDWQIENEYRAFHVVGQKLKFSNLGLILNEVYLGVRFFDDFVTKSEVNNKSKEEFVDFLIENKIKTYCLDTPVQHDYEYAFSYHKLPESWKDIKENFIKPATHRINNI